jgi:L,D-peptidoglycan transpeptidase YkuD (ErfK/YbiS/YcfS/YnhG family)
MTRNDLVVTPSGLRFQGKVYPCTLGRGGIVTVKREGDGGTPAGVHRIVGLLYRPDRVAASELPNWAVPVRPGDLWCEDPDSEDYNLMIRAPHAARAETLRRADPLYDVIVVTGWNWPNAVPGRGSAIFVHAWRRPGAPTAGCIGLRRDHLIRIVNGITHQSRLIVPPLAGQMRR